LGGRVNSGTLASINFGQPSLKRAGNPVVMNSDAESIVVPSSVLLPSQLAQENSVTRSLFNQNVVDFPESTPLEIRFCLF
jgi:hypothetical protein